MRHEWAGERDNSLSLVAMTDVAFQLLLVFVVTAVVPTKLLQNVRTDGALIDGPTIPSPSRAFIVVVELRPGGQYLVQSRRSESNRPLSTAVGDFDVAKAEIFDRLEAFRALQAQDDELSLQTIAVASREMTAENLLRELSRLQDLTGRPWTVSIAVEPRGDL